MYCRRSASWAPTSASSLHVLSTRTDVTLRVLAMLPLFRRADGPAFAPADAAICRYVERDGRITSCQSRSGPAEGGTKGSNASTLPVPVSARHRPRRRVRLSASRRRTTAGRNATLEGSGLAEEEERLQQEAQRALCRSTGSEPQRRRRSLLLRLAESLCGRGHGSPKRSRDRIRRELMERGRVEGRRLQPVSPRCRPRATAALRFPHGDDSMHGRRASVLEAVPGGPGIAPNSQTSGSSAADGRSRARRRRVRASLRVS